MTRSDACTALRRERHGARSIERPPETGDHHEVGVLADAGEATRAERRQAVLVLQALEGTMWPQTEGWPDEWEDGAAQLAALVN